MNSTTNNHNQTTVSPAKKAKLIVDSNENVTFNRYFGYETDQVTLDRRQKQIDYMKNTENYKKYIEHIPKNFRPISNQHPMTPDKNMVASRREWDGRIKKWKIRVHKFVENEFQKGDRININRKRKIFGAPVTQTGCTIPEKRAKIFNYVDLDAPVVEDNLDGPFVDNQDIEEQTSKDSSYFKSQCALKFIQ